MAEVEPVEAKYIEQYDVTVWNYDDHILLAYGDVRESGDKVVNPVWIKKTGGDYDLSRAFVSEIEVDAEDMSAGDFSDVGGGLVRESPDEPEESLY